MKNREPMEITASCCQSRSTRGKGSGATSPGEAQEPVNDYWSRVGFHLVNGRGLLLAQIAGAKASRGTFAATTSTRANKFTRRSYFNTGIAERAHKYKS